MIKIKTQTDFDSIVASTPTTDMIRIYPRDDGQPYTLASPWNLSSNTFIQGVMNPEIQFTGDVSVTSGVIQAIGTVGSELENIRINGLTITGKKTATVALYGIYIKSTGKAPKAGLTTGTYSRYDSTSVGSTIVNKVGVKVENCIVQSNKNAGIYLVSSYNSVLTNNTVQTSDYGIYLNSTSNSTTTNNVVQSNGSHGIYLTSANNNLVVGNTIQNNGNVGLYLNSANNNSVMGNISQNNNGTGVYLYSSSNNTVTGNMVKNNISSNGIYSGASTNNAITGNIIQNNGNYGVFLSTSTNNNTITANVASLNKSVGIYVASNTDNTITGNVSTGNTDGTTAKTGISVSSSTTGIIYSNVYDTMTNIGTFIVDSNMVAT